MVRKGFIIVFLLTCFNVLVAQIDINHFLIEGHRDLNKANYTSAINRFNAIIQVKPDMLEPYYFRGFCKFRLDDLQGAAIDFQKVIELNPYFADGYRFRGIIKALQQDYQDAMEDYAHALELDPGNTNIYTSRGYTYIMLKNYESAIADFNEALKYDNKLASAYFQRGYAKISIDDIQGAIDDFTYGIKLNPYNPEGYSQRAMAFAEKEDFTQALTDMNHAVEIDPNNSVFYFNRAIINYRSNRPDSAMVDYNKVLELNPDNALTYYNRAILNAEIGRTNNAINDYTRVIELNPNNILPYFNRGALRFDMGDYRGAIIDWDKAIEIFPDFARAYLARSQARFSIGDYIGAKKDEQIAKTKIEEYQKRVGEDSTLADFADTSYNFRKVIEFDSDFYRANMDDGEVQHKRIDINLRPSLLLTLIMPTDDKTISMYLPNLEELNNRKIDGYKLGFDENNTTMSVDTVRMLLNITEQTKLVSAFDRDLYFRQGVLNSMVQNYNQSIKAYTSAIGIDPSFELGYLNRAVTRYLMIEYINSFDDISPIVNIDGESQRRIETKLAQTADYDDVISDLDKAIELNPRLGVAYYNRGNVNCMIRNFAAAIDDYSKSITIGPELPQAYFNRGLTLIYLQDKEKGCYDISKAGELGIDDAYVVLKKYCKK